jgi:hypothetical protein
MWVILKTVEDDDEAATAKEVSFPELAQEVYTPRQFLSVFPTIILLFLHFTSNNIT